MGIFFAIVIVILFCSSGRIVYSILKHKERKAQELQEKARLAREAAQRAREAAQRAQEAAQRAREAQKAWEAQEVRRKAQEALRAREAQEAQERQRRAAQEEAQRARADQEARAQAARRAQEAQKAHELKLQSILAKHAQLLDKFYEVTEREVSRRDKYGEEDWDALDEALNVVVAKITKREGQDEQEFLRRHLREFLNQSFRAYHKRKRAQPIAKVDFTTMTGEDFELYLMDLLDRQGYNVCGTPTTGDQGADVLAQKHGRTIVIQAKNYSGSVGNDAVQQVIAAVHFYSGDEGWVITNSTFTSSARDLAQKARVRLIDGHELAQLASRQAGSWA